MLKKLLFLLLAGLTASFSLTSCYKCNHFDTILISNTATCERGGIATYQCQNCNKKIKKESEPLRHTYNIISDTATCTSKGIRTYQCSRCGSKKQETSATKSHNIVGCKCADCGKLDFFFKEVKISYNSSNICDVGGYVSGEGNLSKFYLNYTVFKLRLTKGNTKASFDGVSGAKVEVNIELAIYSSSNQKIVSFKDKIRPSGMPNYNITLSRTISDGETVIMKIHDEVA